MPAGYALAVVPLIRPMTRSSALMNPAADAAMNSGLCTATYGRFCGFDSWANAIADPTRTSAPMVVLITSDDSRRSWRLPSSCDRTRTQRSQRAQRNRRPSATFAAFAVFAFSTAGGTDSSGVCPQVRQLERAPAVGDYHRSIRAVKGVMGAAKRYLLVTWDGGGNVPPELAVCRKLIDRGHSVRVLGDPTMESDARAAGCEFSRWTTAPHRTTRDRSGDVVRDYEWKNPLVMIRTYMREFLAEPTPRWAADVHAELAARPVDALLVDFAIPAALIVAEQWHLPSAIINPQIWMIPTPGIPPLGPGFMPARGPLGHLRDALLRGITTRLFNSALPALNAERQARGLAAIGSTHQQMLRTDCILMLTTPAFDLTSPAMPRHIAWVGPQLDDPTWTETWRSPWTAGDDRPLVLVGLSSTFQDQATVLRRIVEALAALPVRALVTLGPTVRADEVPGADNVTVVATAPHGAVLRDASLLVTHCGHGTTMK